MIGIFTSRVSIIGNSDFQQYHMFHIIIHNNWIYYRYHRLYIDRPKYNIVLAECWLYNTPQLAPTHKHHTKTTSSKSPTHASTTRPPRLSATTVFCVSKERINVHNARESIVQFAIEICVQINQLNFSSCPSLLGNRYSSAHLSAFFKTKNQTNRLVIVDLLSTTFTAYRRENF